MLLDNFQENLDFAVANEEASLSQVFPLTSHKNLIPNNLKVKGCIFKLYQISQSYKNKQWYNSYLAIIPPMCNFDPKPYLGEVFSVQEIKKGMVAIEKE